MSYEKVLEGLLQHEGGYVNDPRDHGGETYRGISRKFFPKWEGWETIDNNSECTYDDLEELQYQVAKFYKTYFWYTIKADQIEDGFIASMLFNFSVNVGKRKVVQKIQRVLGVKIDGVLGPITLGKLNDANPSEFVYHFLLEMVDFYNALGKTQPHYLRGWLNRTMSFYYKYQGQLNE